MVNNSETISKLVVEFFDTADEKDQKLFATANNQNFVEDIVKETLDSPRYARQKERVVLNKIVREVRSRVRKFYSEKALDELETIEGYYLGGNDWKNSKNASLPPDKQSVSFLCEEGFTEMGVFGHSISKEKDMEFGNKYKISFSSFTREKTGRTYLTAKKMEEMERSDDEMYAWIETQTLYADEIQKDDLFTTVFIRSPIKKVEAIPVYSVDESQPMIPVLNGGKQVYDKDDNAVMKHKSKVSGHQDIIQPTLDDSEDELFTGTLKLLVNNEDADEFNQIDVAFYNQRLGRTFNETDDFNLKDNYEDISAMNGADAGEFLTDLYSTGEYLTMAKVTKHTTSINNESGIITNWYKAVGINVRDYDDSVYTAVEEEDKKKY
jgi:hypothetical protein